MKRAYIILNPMADRGRAGEREGELREVFGRLGFKFALVRTEWPGHGTEIAKTALAEGASMVVAAGGDGTANEVAQALVGTDVPLGIIPLGSGNDYIRALGIPNNLGQAVKILAQGQVRLMDVAQAADRFYLNSFGMGVDGQIAEDYRRMRFLKGELGYLWAALLEVARFRPFHGELEVEGCPQSENLLMISVMNGPYAGGGFHLAPGARADDGVLDLVLVSNYRRLARIAVLFMVRQGRHPQLRRVRLQRAQRIRIRTDRPVPVHMDGELLPKMDELEARLLPKVLHVIA